MRPSYLDMKREEPNPGTPVLNDDKSTQESTLLGLTDERNAANAQIVDLEQVLASTQGELHRATARADEALEQIEPLQTEISTLKAYLPQIDAEKADAMHRAAEAQRLLEDHTAEFDANVDRLKACEHIADGDEGWQNLRNECPSTAAVARLRDSLDEANAQIAELTKPEEPTDDPSPKRKKGS